MIVAFEQFPTNWAMHCTGQHHRGHGFVSRWSRLNFSEVFNRQLLISVESNCFGLWLLYSVIGSNFSRHFCNQSEVKPKPIVARAWTFSRALSLLPCNYVDFWLAKVITLALVLRHSIETRSNRQLLKLSRLVRGSSFSFVYRWFSPDVTAAMLVYRTIEEKVFWEFDSIIMQNMCRNLLLFCTQTWPSHHVIENHL